MYTSRSATYKMMLSQAPRNRQIRKFPPPFQHHTTPYQQLDFYKPLGTLIDCNMEASCLRIAKAIFLGDVAVGKTCIINRFCHEAYNNDYKATIGVDFEVERFDILGMPFNVQIWDTAGQERFKSIASSYYRGAHIVAVVFDLTSVRSLVNCELWLREALAVNPNSPLTFLIGNKMDLLSPASLHEMKKMGVKTAARLQAEFWPVSARTGENVDEMFRRMAALTFDGQLRKETPRSSTTLRIGTIDVSRKSPSVETKKRNLCVNCTA